MRRCVAAVLCLALTGCFAASAGRRSARVLSNAWDTEKHGAAVVVTGPAMTIFALPDFLFHSFVPVHYDGSLFATPSEPPQKWFRFYDGPLQPLSEVAILCSRERATTVTTIRSEGHERATYARHQKWHYPQCIEVLPGTYELTVDFYSRETFRRDLVTATYSTESTSPATILWEPGPGEAYELWAQLGDVSPAPGTTFQGTTIKRLTRSHTNLGASEFTLDEGHWLAVVEPVDSFAAFPAPVLEHRESWRRYEMRKPSP